ncbi:MAG: citrate lyase holo-[acyl-carrier protein] synthase [Fusobacteria bacterium]|nr:citrate lyase holo-[acyl-carrier protein] synthase [Fusobacteriota bacterium]
MKKFKKIQKAEFGKIVEIHRYQEALLEVRERRFEKIQKKCEQFGHCLVLSINIPGANKRSALGKRIYFEAVRILRSKIGIKIILQEEFEHFDGNFCFFTFHLYRESLTRIKKLCIQIEENHFLGRFFDLDYYMVDEFEKTRSISRGNMNRELRKCYICSKMAKVCVKEKNHTEIELYEAMTKRVNQFKKWVNLWR